MSYKIIVFLIAYEGGLKNSHTYITILISIEHKGKIVTLGEHPDLEREFLKEVNT